MCVNQNGYETLQCDSARLCTGTSTSIITYIYLIIMHQTQLEERIDFINYKNIIAKSCGIVKIRIIEEKESERRILLLFNFNQDQIDNERILI